MKITSGKILFGLAVFLLFGATAQAATFTAAANGDWATPATWTFTGTDADGIPDADDSVTIPNPRTVTVTGAQSAQNLTVNSGGTLTINGTLTMSGTPSSSVSNGGTTNGSGSLRTTGTTTISIGGTFTASLVIASGVTTGGGSTVGGSITILNGAELRLFNVFFDHSGNLNVNAGGILSGDAGGSNGSTYRFSGANVVNNGSVPVAVFQFNGTAQTLSGTGTFTGTNIIVVSGSTTTLTSNVTAAPTNFVVNSGGTLQVGGNTLTLNGVNFSNSGTATSTGAGSLQAQGASSLSIGGTFTASLVIASGITTGGGSTVGGSITILSGAELQLFNVFFDHSGDLNVNAGGILSGDTSGGNGSTYRFSGANVVNDGTISVAVFNFTRSGIQNLSGTGTFTGSNVAIVSSSTVNLTGNVTAAPTNFTVNGGGTLQVGGNTLTLNGVNFSNSGTATSTGAGSLQTQGASAFTSANGFTASLVIASGITTGGGSTVGGSITILSGAELRLFNVFFDHSGDLNVNAGGILSGDTGGSNGSTYRFSGANVINNGTVSVSVFRFQGTTQTLSGTGAFTTPFLQILNGSTTTLGSNHQLNTLTVNGGGTFNTAAFTAFLNGAGTPLSNSGTAINGSFTYNGTAAQTVQTTNVDYTQLGVNNAAGVTLPATKIVSQQLTLTNGALNSNSNLMLADNATIVRDSGTLAAPPTFTGSINLLYIGATTPQTTGNELPTIAATLKNLTINKLVGTTLNLNAAGTVNGALTLTSGFLLTGANTLTVADTGTASGTENGYLIGSLTKQYAQIQPFVYPLGTANGYSPLNVNVTNVTIIPSSLVVGVTQTVQPDVSASEQSAALKRYWTLNETGNLAAVLQFNYRQADVPAGVTESEFRLRRYTGGTGTPVPSTTNPNSNTITTPGPVTDFSDWTAIALGPTAAEASLGGRVVNSKNQPIAGATVIITNSEGAAVAVKTNPFGYFQFSDLKAGESYVLSARQKRYVFTPQVINLTADLAEIVITGQ